MKTVPKISVFQILLLTALVDGYPIDRTGGTIPIFGPSYPEENRDVDNTFLMQGDILMDVRRSAVRDHSNVWLRRIVPYVVDASYSQFTKQQIMLAFQDMEKYSCVQFKPRDNEVDYIYIRPVQGCYSPVGRKGGPQDVSIGKGCEAKGTIMHELMHALGFWHEQSRPDRDSYITIIWDNIAEIHKQNFRAYSTDEIDTLGAPYDYGSIMHYALNAFAIDRSKWTIVPKLATNAEIGQRKWLSKIDIFKLNKLYNCNITHCPAIEVPKHGYKQGSDYSVGKTVYYYCPAGYILIGSTERFCKNTGDWSGNLPACLPDDVVYCNFDKADLCGWRQDKEDDLNWSWTHSNTPTAHTGPSGDYTLGNSQGYYLFLESSQPAVSGQKARLLSATTMPFASSICLRFYYNMYGSGMGSLRVYLRERDKDIMMFSISGDQGKEWHVADVILRPTVNFQVVFEAIRGTNFRSDVAIDDVILATCNIMDKYRHTLEKKKETTTSAPNPAANLVRNQKCDFNTDLCNWSQSSRDMFDWILHKGPTKTINTGPSCDRTDCVKGHYLYIEASSPRTVGDFAVLLSPVFSGHAAKCMKFHYHMLGSTMGTLNVYLKNSTGPYLIWTMSGNQGPSWYFAYLDLISNSPFQILFEAVRGIGYRSDIAIDDFSLYPGQCLASTINCDFERDLCGWEQDESDNFNWSRMHGSTPTPGTGPNHDHTGNGTAVGFYVYIESSSPRKKNDVARLVSPVLNPIPGGYCITFWYYMYGTHVSYLRIFTMTFDYTAHILWQSEGNKGPQWNFRNVSFSLAEQAQLVVEAMVGESYRSDIAMDDTDLSQGSC